MLLCGLALLPASKAQSKPPQVTPDQSKPPQVTPDQSTSELLLQLDQRLLASRSATKTLSDWCDEYQLATDASIRAEGEKHFIHDAPKEVYRQLKVAPGSRLGHRKVRLICGDRVLSVADNWYVPELLTQEMNQQLQHTKTPFGTAVKALDFRRENLQSLKLWQGSKVLPPFVLQHKALLLRADDKPFSLVIERYTSELLPKSSANKPSAKQPSMAQ
ncbi:hypothetical protein ACOI2Q_02930 [Shewanella algae]|uniref:hypothetical protein n=1 Tax=Shewanella algae TaxID=38313 RepID=UPI001AACFA2C|nr:hypothetical protein [Shewanella algae]MBO2672422.1 hypothetical protein [Shewanella algae]